MRCTTTYLFLVLCVLLLVTFPAFLQTSPTAAYAQSKYTTLLKGLNHPVGVAVDSDGNIYFTEYGGVGKGRLSILFNNGTVKNIFSNLTTPTGVAVDSNWLYFAESSLGLIRKVSLKNFKNVEVVAKNVTGVWGLALDGKGYLYFTIKSINGTIKKINLQTGEIEVVAKNLNVPYNVAVDSDGNIFFVEFMGGTLKKISSLTGEIKVLLENLTYPYSVAVDSSGNIYLTVKAGNLLKFSEVNASLNVMLSGLGRVYGLTVDPKGYNIYFVGFGDPMRENTGYLAKLPIKFNPLIGISERIGRLESQISSLKKELSLLDASIISLRSQLQLTIYWIIALTVAFLILLVFTLSRSLRERETFKIRKFSGRR